MLSSVAPFRFAYHRSARTSLVEERLAFDKSARRRLALSKFNPLKFTPLRLQLAHDPVSVSVCRSSPSTRAHCQYKTLATNEKNPAISNRFLDTTEEADADKLSRPPSNLDHLSHWIGTNLWVIYIHSNFHLAKVSYALSFPTFLKNVDIVVT